MEHPKIALLYTLICGMGFLFNVYANSGVSSSESSGCTIAQMVPLSSTMLFLSAAFFLGSSVAFGACLVLAPFARRDFLLQNNYQLGNGGVVNVVDHFGQLVRECGVGLTVSLMCVSRLLFECIAKPSPHTVQTAFFLTFCVQFLSVCFLKFV